MAGDTLTVRSTLPFVVVIVIGCLVSPFLGFARAGALDTMRPASVFHRTTLGFHRVFSSIRDIGTLRARVAALEAENAVLKSEHIVQQESVQEQQLISKQQASADALHAGTTIPARVISRSPTLLLDTITLDKGSVDGVALHDAVVADGFFAGVIHTISGHESQVLLITNPSLMIPVLFQTTRAQGLFQSSLEGLIVGDVPSSIAIKSGEVVLTNDIGHVVPHGLPIGTVDRTITATSDIVQRVRIQSPIVFHQLEYVGILQSSSERQ